MNNITLLDKDVVSNEISGMDQDQLSHIVDDIQERKSRIAFISKMHVFDSDSNFRVQDWTLLDKDSWKASPIGTLPDGSLPILNLPDEMDDLTFAIKNGLFCFPLQTSRLAEDTVVSSYEEIPTKSNLMDFDISDQIILL